MPVKKPQQIIGFKYVGTSPVAIIGLGELNPGDIVPLDKAKEIWGNDFAGSEVLVPVEVEDVGGASAPNKNGGES